LPSARRLSFSGILDHSSQIIIETLRQSFAGPTHFSDDAICGLMKKGDRHRKEL